jgi:hypothetical protein
MALAYLRCTACEQFRWMLKAPGIIGPQHHERMNISRIVSIELPLHYHSGIDVAGIRIHSRLALNQIDWIKFADDAATEMVCCGSLTPILARAESNSLFDHLVRGAEQLRMEFEA